MTDTKNCLVCGKEFKPCNTCSGATNDMYNWRKVVCCREHFYYHVPIIDYIRKKVSKADARKDLTKAIQDFGEIEFADNIKSIAEEILTEEKKSKKLAKVVVNTDVDSDNSVSETTVVEKSNKDETII